MNAVCRKKSAGKHVRFNLIIYTATICAEGEKSMFIKIALYALFSSMGLVFLKLGTKQGLYVVFERQAFSFHMNYIAVLGMCFYIAGFLLSLSNNTFIPYFSKYVTVFSLYLFDKSSL